MMGLSMGDPLADIMRAYMMSASVQEPGWDPWSVMPAAAPAPAPAPAPAASPLPAWAQAYSNVIDPRASPMFGAVDAGSGSATVGAGDGSSVYTGLPDHLFDTFGVGIDETRRINQDRLAEYLGQNQLREGYGPGQMARWMQDPQGNVTGPVDVFSTADPAFAAAVAAAMAVTGANIGLAMGNGFMPGLGEAMGAGSSAPQMTPAMIESAVGSPGYGASSVGAGNAMSGAGLDALYGMPQAGEVAGSGLQMGGGSSGLSAGSVGGSGLTAAPGSGMTLAAPTGTGAGLSAAPGAGLTLAAPTGTGAGLALGTGADVIGAGLGSSIPTGSMVSEAVQAMAPAAGAPTTAPAGSPASQQPSPTPGLGLPSGTDLLGRLLSNPQALGALLGGLLGGTSGTTGGGGDGGAPAGPPVAWSSGLQMGIQPTARRAQPTALRAAPMSSGAGRFAR